MNPSMIMSYLSDLDCNSNVEVNIVRSKHCDQIEIITDEFTFVVDEFGLYSVKTDDCWSEDYQDINIWKLVKTWVKNYLNEIL